MRRIDSVVAFKGEVFYDSYRGTTYMGNMPYILWHLYEDNTIGPESDRYTTAVGILAVL